MPRSESLFGAILILALATSAGAQTAETREDEAVGQSINYVFAADLGSGVYDLDGRTLQIYRFTYTRELREVDEDTLGVRFKMPLTFGFFDFKPFDVLTQGIPTRVDSFSLVPGFEFDHLLRNDWHFVPYARGGINVASSSIDGWLYGVGLRLERHSDWHGWDSFVRTELNYSGVGYRQDLPADEFLRLRQGADVTRGIGWKLRDREVELGLYAIVDVILDPPTAPVGDRPGESIQAEFGFTFATRARFKLWRWDAPRLGFGYRLAGELSAWHFLIGTPF